MEPSNVEEHGPEDNPFPFGITLKGRKPSTAYGGGRAIVTYAQDAQGRHVAIKATKKGSEEHRILQYLHAQGVPESIENFSHLIPVLELLQYGDYCFAVMPRIIHGDIKIDNILVNNFARISMTLPIPVVHMYDRKAV
ncbi:hypothetical protein H0H81_001019 [Sphagnurus paluster]|uniref:Protein kinase domain-containing protein n=1 Tax=Sphagnurus paluster TaxID=117069 RepID=A0A9P7K6U0_9AGAR|nr:hypothetical protein H0H81_001019 [Sphagnurus paluster]